MMIISEAHSSAYNLRLKLVHTHRKRYAKVRWNLLCADRALRPDAPQVLYLVLLTASTVDRLVFIFVAIVKPLRRALIGKRDGES